MGHCWQNPGLALLSGGHLAGLEEEDMRGHGKRSGSASEPEISGSASHLSYRLAQVPSLPGTPKSVGVDLGVQRDGQH